jgi:DNA-binding MarR family transcriptional regulator
MVARCGELQSRSAEPAPALRRTIELLFFAYRDFTGDADALLRGYGFGRAHHRVIYFVGRHPNITVSELLAILKITKQSLARVLSQLMRQGFIVQTTDPADRRRRRLTLTAKAEALERVLTEHQARRIAQAYAAAGDAAAAGFCKVLEAMIGSTAAPDARQTNARRGNQADRRDEP